MKVSVSTSSRLVCSRWSEGVSVGERKKEDEQLFEEEYAKLKGETEKKYALIPKFYSKVSCLLNVLLRYPAIWLVYGDHTCYSTVCEHACVC